MDHKAQGRKAAGLGARWEHQFDFEMKRIGAMSITQHPESKFAFRQGKSISRVVGRAFVDRIVFWVGQAFALELKSTQAKNKFSPNKKGGRLGGPEIQFLNLVDAASAGIAAAYIVYWGEYNEIEVFRVTAEGANHWPIKFNRGEGSLTLAAAKNWGQEMLTSLQIAAWAKT